MPNVLVCSLAVYLYDDIDENITIFLCEWYRVFRRIFVLAFKAYVNSSTAEQMTRVPCYVSKSIRNFKHSLISTKER